MQATLGGGFLTSGYIYWVSCENSTPYSCFFVVWVYSFLSVAYYFGRVIFVRITAQSAAAESHHRLGGSGVGGVARSYTVYNLTSIPAVL